MEKAFLSIDLAGTSSSGLTQVWRVSSTSGQILLGEIKWHAPWRRYVFLPLSECLFDATCLNAIAAFITKEMETRQNARGQS